MVSASDQDRHQHRHQADTYRRIELITGSMRRRRWMPEEKAQILTESLLPGASVADVARRYGVNRGLLSNWRRKAVRAPADAEPSFVPLRLAVEPASPVQAEQLGRAQTDTALPSMSSGSIEIEFGPIRVRIQGAVDSETLRQVLLHVGRAR